MADTSSTQSRTAVILSAVRAQLEERRGLIDRAADLGELQITVRLQAGTNVVRSVSVSEERIYRRTG